MSKPTLILFPGMGADQRLFQPQRALPYPLITPRWIELEAGEGLPDYARRMASRIDKPERFILGGVSLGGMVAAELASTGPWKDRVTYGQTLQAWSGFTDLTGFPETRPSGPASAYSDAVAGMAGAQAVLLALIQRARTGQGQWIDISQMEAMSALLGPLVLELSANKIDVQRTGNRLAHGGGAPHGAYRCQGEDRWLAITVFTDDEWNAFAGAIGSPEWVSDQRFATVDSRLRHADDLDKLVESWTMGQNAEEAMHLLQSAGVAAGVVQTGKDLAENDPQLSERGLFQQVPDAAGVLRTIERAPYKLSRTPGTVTKGAPEFGADQTFVLSEVLGIGDDELAEMAIAGAFD